MNSKQISINLILQFLKIKNHNIKNKKIMKFAPFDSATNEDITFLNENDKTAILKLKSSKASLIICSKKLEKKISYSKNIIFVENPRLEFIRCLNEFFPKFNNEGIDSTSIVKTKKIGKNVSIGPFSYISKEVSIGDDVEIFGNVYIYDNTKIGNNVTIHAGTVIGSDGFGFEKNKNGSYEKFPHIGGVEIHDNVEIGATNCIDRGTLQNTVIGRGTKTDNLVHIAHNVHIGKNCLLTAGVTTSGSCKIGDDVYIGTAATIRDWIKIGRNSFIGIGSLVVKNVPSGITVMGSPAKPYKKRN